MACFLVPTAEAIVTTVAEKIIRKREITKGTESENKIALSEKLKWLNGFLWGGSGLLAFEHLWHGEITPFFPFLTSASNPADFAEMLTEMATSGTAMAVAVTGIWALACYVTSRNHDTEKMLSERRKI